VPEKECADKVESDYEFYVKSTCGGGDRNLSSLDELIEIRGGREPGNADNWNALSCQIFAYAILRRGRLEKCPKTLDPSVCGPGGRCNANTGRCVQPDCGPASARARRSRQSVSRELSALGEPEPSARSSAARRHPSVTKMIATLKRSRRALGGSGARLVRAYAAAGATSSTKPPAELLAAMDAYERDIVRLRASIRKIKTPARPRTGPRRTRNLIIETLSLAVQGIEDSHRAATALTVGGAEARATDARRSFNQGARAAKRARRALGCARGC
jgi:hypothetical protein